MPEFDWKCETGKYVPRLRTILNDLHINADLFKEMPTAPFANTPPEPSRLAWLISAACLEALASVHENLRGLISEWEAGRVLNAAVLTRSIFELWSFSHYVRVELFGLASSDGRLERLWHGSSSSVKLPGGGYSTDPPIGVREYVESLKSEYANAGQEYSFLCDAAHPTLLQHKYLRMAGEHEDNWSNEIFRAHAHEILGRLAEIAERASLGTKGDAVVVLTDSIPKLRLIDGTP
ncbi:MAG: hypothetical protein ACM3MH_06690 [Actinomycetota bacterium]